MKVLVVGSGGREHALCRKLASSPLVEKVFVAPGNAGCEPVAERVAIRVDQVDALTSFVHEHRVDLTVVGPEVPLCEGLVDQIQRLGLKAFGPTRGAACLEGSKAFAKRITRQHNIPSPDFKVFPSGAAARAYLERAELSFPLVVKADGLAAGKGVRICRSKGEALEHILDCSDRGRFGERDQSILIEEFLEGREVSVMVVTDGRTLLVLDPAQDYKAAFDGNKGPNTGGMGAVSPSSISRKQMRRIEEKILVPTVHAMRRRAALFKGSCTRA